MPFANLASIFPPHSLLAVVLVQQGLFCCINVRCALLLMMLQDKDKPESEIPLWKTQTRLSCSERGANDFLHATQRKVKTAFMFLENPEGRAQHKGLH